MTAGGLPPDDISEVDGSEGPDAPLSPGEMAFLAARYAVDRSAFTRYLLAEGIISKDKPAVDAALARHRALGLLRDPALRAYSLKALAGARGCEVNSERPFPATLWLGGASDVEGGRDFLKIKGGGTIAQFVDLLKERARQVAPKTVGWVLEPTTCPSGRRTNQATLAVHALFLDCDGTGEWHALLHALSDLGYCLVAYQSGGWSLTSPKWRIVLPLSRPFDTSTEAGQLAWKGFYGHARVAFGSVADLSGVGFDPATETPCNPWFLTEKRASGDPERVVFWRSGAALDATALMLALPPAPRVEVSPSVDRADIEPVSLDEAQVNALIDALVIATAHVPTGRRDLYLSLPGVLLDRGVAPDDVFAIIEAVSAGYPRPHADKHADNLHNARTTIAKWEARERVTRIGTLNAVAPLVAQTLDDLLPDRASKAIVDAVTEMLAAKQESLQDVFHRKLRGPAAAPPRSDSMSSSTPNSAASAVSTPAHRRGPLSELGREVAQISAQLKKTKKYKLEGVLIRCLVDGAPLPLSPLMSLDEMVCRCMRALGRNLTVARTWHEVLDFAGASLLSMDFTQSAPRVAAAERAFYEGQVKRKKSLKKKADAAAEFKRRENAFFSAPKGGAAR